MVNYSVHQKKKMVNYCDPTLSQVVKCESWAKQIGSVCCLLLRMELSSSSSFSTSLPALPKWNSSFYSFSFKLPISTTNSIATAKPSPLFFGFSKHLRSVGHYHHHRRSSPSPIPTTKTQKRPISIRVRCLIFVSLLKF